MKRRWIAALTSFLILTVLTPPMKALGNQGWEETDRGMAYLKEDGSQARNEWIKEETGWYYVKKNGVAATEDDGWVTVEGKRYRFDAEGVMMTGWQEIGSSLYYLDPHSGAPLTGWNYLALNTTDESQYLHEEGINELGWFWFDSRGVCYRKNASKKINGRYYYFDKNGMMLYGWVYTGSDSNALEEEIYREGLSGRIDQYVFCGAPEDGARKEGWIYTMAPQTVDDSGDLCYFYLDKGRARSIWDSDGSGSFRSLRLLRFAPIIEEESGKGLFYRCDINGKYYAFDYRGAMQEGLFPCYDEDGNLIGSYYFETETGEMALGKNAKVTESEEPGQSYYFKESGDNRGMGITGIRENTLYYAGKRQEAQDADYTVISYPEDLTAPHETRYVTCIVDKKGRVQKKTGKKYETDNLGDVILFKTGTTLQVYAYADSKKREDYVGAEPLIGDMEDCSDYLDALREPEW